MLLQTEIKFTKHSQTREEDPLTPELVCPPQLLILHRQVAAQTQILGHQNFAKDLASHQEKYVVMAYHEFLTYKACPKG